MSFQLIRNRPERTRARANRDLLGDVRRLHGRYGRSTKYAAFRAENATASLGRVEQPIRLCGILALADRRFWPCSIWGIAKSSASSFYFP